MIEALKTSVLSRNSIRKVVVVGAGPVGALAALYAAKAGHDVEVYELRGDIRHDTTTPLNFTKSINLALSQRGITALQSAQCPGLVEGILADTIPMHGRMVHSCSHNGELVEESQAYDAHGRFIRAADRAALNKALIEELAKFDNVKLLFDHKLTGADLDKGLAWLEDRSPTSLTGAEAENSYLRENQKRAAQARPREIEVGFDLLIGADGAHSAVRFHLMKFARVSYQQEYIDTLWCEFHIAPKTTYDGTATATSDADEETEFAISQHHLHIWPTPSESVDQMMFIAIPSSDKSFTCTLFAPPHIFKDLLVSSSTLVPSFFEKNFPGVTNLISPGDLVDQFNKNPHLPLISIKCQPYHYASALSDDNGQAKCGAVIVGDAAHAMVPFYGQGMNAGLEDVRVLFDTLSARPASHHEETPGTHNAPGDLGEALKTYTHVRKPDAHAIVELSMRNFTEMRSAVTSPVYLLRKKVEELLSVWMPWTGFKTQYARVSFSDEEYDQVIKGVERQSSILSLFGLSSVLAIGVMGATWYIRGRQLLTRR